MPILESAAKLKDLVEGYGVDSEGGKNLDLSESAHILTYVFDEPMHLYVTRVRTFDGTVFLTDEEYSFFIDLLEDEQNPGKPLLLYENELFRRVNGPGCSEVGECLDTDPFDIEKVLFIAQITIHPPR